MPPPKTLSVTFLWSIIFSFLDLTWCAVINKGKISCGDSLIDNLAAGDIHEYNFTSTGEPITFDTCLSGGSLDTVIKYFDSSGVIFEGQCQDSIGIGTCTPCGIDHEKSEITFAAGDWRVGIEDFFGSNTGSYQLVMDCGTESPTTSTPITNIPTTSSPTIEQCVIFFIDDMNTVPGEWNKISGLDVELYNSAPQCIDSTGCWRTDDHSYYSREVSTYGYANISLAFNFYESGVELAEYCRIKYSLINDFTTTNLFEEHGDVDDFGKKTVFLPSRMDNQLNVTLYIQSTANGGTIGNEYCYFDNIQFCGFAVQFTPTTAIPSNVPTTSTPTTVPSTVPTTAAPVTSIPTTISPITAEPTTIAPVTSFPTTMSPITSEPTTIAPVTSFPTTMVPITSVPVTTVTNSLTTTIGLDTTDIIDTHEGHADDTSTTIFKESNASLGSEDNNSDIVMIVAIIAGLIAFIVLIFGILFCYRIKTKNGVNQREENRDKMEMINVGNPVATHVMSLSANSDNDVIGDGGGDLLPTTDGNTPQYIDNTNNLDGREMGEDDELQNQNGSGIHGELLDEGNDDDMYALTTPVKNNHNTPQTPINVGVTPQDYRLGDDEDDNDAMYGKGNKTKQ